MPPREPTFCTVIAPSTRYAFVIDSTRRLAGLGNRAAAFLTGQKASAINENVHAELAEYRAAALALGTRLFELRWVDDDDTLLAVDSEDDDGVNLTVVSPWGCYDVPRGGDKNRSNIAIFLQREPTAEELAVLQARAVTFFARHDITDLAFFLVRQVMTVEEVPLAALAAAAGAAA